MTQDLFSTPAPVCSIPDKGDKAMWAIYIITAVGFAWIKIGIAKDPYKRVKDLQTGSPFKLALFGFWWVGSYAVARTLETAVHIALAPFRQVGEWFDVTPEDAQQTIIQKAADLGITVTWVAVVVQTLLAA